jgi:thymidylate synthase
MKIYKGNSFADVYSQSLKDLYISPQFETEPRGMKIKENLQVSLEIKNPILSMYENDRRGSQFKYIAAELLWYFLGRNDVEFISEYASFWKHIQNEDGTVNSSYGNLLFNNKNRFGITQYQWAINSLLNDKDSRQAVMHFNLPEHQYNSNKDFVCTMYGIFHIRDNKLFLSVNMRSNDAILGTPTDIAFFTVLQQQALNHLRSHYPDLTLGSYTHTVDSYHIYERHFDLVKDMISKDWKPVEFPKLNKNLINQNGKPTTNLELLEAHFKTRNAPIIIDEVYNWIQNNINYETSNI